ENFGQVKAKLLVWTGGQNVPILAFAPRGGHLAVAGNDQHEIKVFPILELTKPEPKFQTLKSAGANFRAIAFVKKSNDVALILRKGNEERRRITLKRLHEVTHFVVLSPVGPATVPILALAFLDELKQPYLFLYNAETGEQIRQYTGHTDPIRSLAFSSDGRLL